MTLDVERVKRMYNKVEDLLFGDYETGLEFRTALLIYDRVYDVENAGDITEKIVDRVSDIADRWESMYREEINREIDAKINYADDVYDDDEDDGGY